MCEFKERRNKQTMQQALLKKRYVRESEAQKTLTHVQVFLIKFKH